LTSLNCIKYTPKIIQFNFFAIAYFLRFPNKRNYKYLKHNKLLEALCLTCGGQVKSKRLIHLGQGISRTDSRSLNGSNKATEV
jgi:hypothetical protein